MQYVNTEVYAVIHQQYLIAKCYKYAALRNSQSNSRIFTVNLCNECCIAYHREMRFMDMHASTCGRQYA